MAHETNLHRAARQLQQASDLTYQQARRQVEAHRAAPKRGPLEPSQRVALHDAHIDGFGVVVELAVNGNPNLVRFALEGGDTVVLDARRFSPATLDPVRDTDVDATVTGAHTSEAGDLEMLLGLSTEVVAARVDDTWELRCVSDPDTVNYATVTGRLTDTQLTAWFAAHFDGPFAIASPPDGTDEPIDCVRAGTHLTSCDDDGYCNFCGHQDSPEQVERDARTDLCDECRDVDHQTCSLDPSCGCCATTIAQLATRH